MYTSKKQKMAPFSEEFLSENDFKAVLTAFCCYEFVSTLLRQLRRSLYMKNIIRNAPCVL